jgi:hypothetical protein
MNQHSSICAYLIRVCVNLQGRLHLQRALALPIVLFILPVFASAQISGGVKAEPVIATGASTGTSDANYIDAFVYSSTGDMCARIEAAWAATSTPSAVIDARGFTGAQTCSETPFPPYASTPVTRYGVLLLGNAQISTSVTWNIPPRVRVLGLGSQGAEGTNMNTLIYAGSSFPTSTPVVQLGNPDSAKTKAYQSQILDLTIDCMAVAGCVGLYNDSAEEESYAQNIIVFNAPVIGVHITSSSGIVPGGAGNSGPYRNINVQFSSTCTTALCGSAIGLQIDGAGPGYGIRGFDNFTVSGCLGSGSCTSGISEPGILIYGAPVSLTNSHVEYFGPQIQIGLPSSSEATTDVQVQNVDFAVVQDSQYDVLIDGNSTTSVGGVVLMGLSDTASAKLLDDTVTGNTITASNLGFYLLGDITSTASDTAVISSNSTPSWVAPGALKVVGSLSKGGGSFEIDHPLDPANKYLRHSFVESPDMMNVYNGNITTDRHGLAVVTLPSYFDALNKDFRYQLTAVGSFAQATVAREIHDNQFTIRTNKPDVKVSWQVTGVRHDAYAEQNRIQVEEDKAPRDRGHYLHPSAVASADTE